MKLNIFNYCLSLIIVYGCSQKSDLNKQDLKGKVKSITTLTFKAILRFGKPEKDEPLSILIQRFNVDGQLTEDSGAYFKDDISYKNIVEFDKNGKVIATNRYNSEGQLTNKIICCYNDDNLLIEEDEYNKEGNFTSKDLIKYDKRGNEIERLKEPADYLKLQVNQYDNEDKLIQTDYYDSSGKLSFGSKFLHDENNRTIKMLSYQNDNTVIDTHKFTYDEIDEKGNWTVKVQYLNDPTDIEYRSIEYYQ